MWVLVCALVRSPSVVIRKRQLDAVAGTKIAATTARRVGGQVRARPSVALNPRVAITDPWDIADWYLVPSPPMTRPASTLWTLYYWPIPGRGVFVSSLFAFTNTALHEAPVEEIVRIKNAPPAEQPIPLRAPPFLVDHGADDFATSQLPAVAFYAASKLDLMPTDLQKQSLALKALEAPPH